MEWNLVSKRYSVLTLPETTNLVILSKSDILYGSFALTNKINGQNYIKYIYSIIFSSAALFSLWVLHFLLPLYTFILLKPQISVQQWLLPCLNPTQGKTAKSRNRVMMNRMSAVIIVANQSFRIQLEHTRKQNHYTDVVCDIHIIWALLKSG